MTVYFTFMGKQHDTRGRSMRDYYTTVEADDVDKAREIYFAKYGDQFFTTYQSAEDAGVERFGLQYCNFEGLDLCCGVAQEDYKQMKERADV